MWRCVSHKYKHHSHAGSRHAKCRHVVAQVGDDVYVVTDPEKFNAAGGLNEQEEFEVCEVCHKAGHRNAPLLECSGCARGFHTKCVGLTDVPKVRTHVSSSAAIGLLQLYSSQYISMVHDTRCSLVHISATKPRIFAS